MFETRPVSLEESSLSVNVATCRHKLFFVNIAREPALRASLRPADYLDEAARRFSAAALGRDQGMVVKFPHLRSMPAREGRVRSIPVMRIRPQPLQTERTRTPSP